MKQLLTLSAAAIACAAFFGTVGPAAAASALAAGLIDLGFIILVLVRAMREV